MAGEGGCGAAARSGPALLGGVLWARSGRRAGQVGAVGLGGEWPRGRAVVV